MGKSIFTAPAAPGLLENRVRIHPLLQERLPLGLERPGRADTHTLAAKNTGGIRHRQILEGGDLSMETATIEVQSIGELSIVGADLDAAPAVDVM